MFRIPNKHLKILQFTNLNWLLKTIVLPTVVWLAIVLLFYNYVILQWSLVLPNWSLWLPLALAVLALLSGLFCCLEMAIANTSLNNLDEWLEKIPKPSEELKKKYMDMWDRHSKIVENGDEYNQVVVLINNLINVGLAVICIVAIDASTNTFPKSVPGVPFFGKIPHLNWMHNFANKYFLPGAPGFVAIGVALITLFASETLPKKVARRYKPRTLFALSCIITFLDFFQITKVCQFGIFMPVEKLLQLVEFLGGKIRR